MSKSPTPVDDTVTTGSQHSSAHEAELRAADPDLANEIYGTTAEKAAGTVTTGQPTPPGEPEPAAPAAGDPPAPAAAAPATPEPAAATPGDPAAPPTPSSASTPMVPLARLNEVLGRLDTVTQQLEATRAGGGTPAATPAAAPAQPAAPAAPAFDLPAKLKEKLQAQWDGNEDRVIELELEIEAHRQEQANAAAVAAVQQDRAQNTLAATLAQVGEQIVTEFPQLDNRKDGYNPDAIAAFKAERDVQIAAGKAPDVAMRRAAALVAIDYGLQKATPAPAPTPTPAGGGIDPVTARTVDVARIAAQTANTPPNNVGGRGQGDLAPETKNYSREEWLSLDARQKNEALGIE